MGWPTVLLDGLIILSCLQISINGQPLWEKRQCLLRLLELKLRLELDI